MLSRVEHEFFSTTGPGICATTIRALIICNVSRFLFLLDSVCYLVQFVISFDRVHVFENTIFLLIILLSSVNTVYL